MRRKKVDLYATLSGLIGTIIGGFITWLNTKYNLNRQFKDQLKRAEIQDRKSERIALNSVLKEIEYNLIQLDVIKHIMKEEKMDFINYKASDSSNNLTKEKWIKHSDTIEFIEDLECLPSLQTFYINLSMEVNNQINNLERTNQHITAGLKLTKELKDYLEQGKN